MTSPGKIDKFIDKTEKSTYGHNLFSSSRFGANVKSVVDCRTCNGLAHFASSSCPQSSALTFATKTEMKIAN